MYFATFAKGQFDDEFHRIDQEIATPGGGPPPALPALVRGPTPGRSDQAKAWSVD